MTSEALSITMNDESILFSSAVHKRNVIARYIEMEEIDDMDEKQRMMEKALKFSVEEVYGAQEFTVNGLMKPEFAGCSYKDKSFTIAFPVLQWEVNRGGFMHGGIIASAFDIVMGMLNRHWAGGLNYTPTINLETTYIRPISLGDQFIVTAKINYSGKTVTHLYGEGYVKSTGKLAATATSSYMGYDTVKARETLF